MSDLKLTIQIKKPSYAQKKTVRNTIPRSLWDAVRSHVQEKNDYKCQICGYADAEKLQAHEVWGYDEEKFLLILEDVQALCRMCHDLKHYFHVALRIKDEDLRKRVMNDLRDHFMKVNNCNQDVLKEHLRERKFKQTSTFRNMSADEMEAHIEREKFLKEQDWKFVIREEIPLSNEIKSVLKKKNRLFEG